MDKEKEILKVVADNPNLLRVLKQTILDEFEIAPPQSDLTVSDEILGQILRARLVGISKVETAFKKVLLYKTIAENEEKRNQAR